MMLEKMCQQHHYCVSIVVIFVFITISTAIATIKSIKISTSTAAYPFDCMPRSSYSGHVLEKPLKGLHVLPGEACALPVDLQMGTAFVVDGAPGASTLQTSAHMLRLVKHPSKPLLSPKALSHPPSQRAQPCNHGALATAWRQFLASSHTWRKSNSSSTPKVLTDAQRASG